MRQLSNVEVWLMLAGGLLMVVGAGASLFLAAWAPYVFAPGALLFAAMQMRQTYDGDDFTVKRLRRIMLLSDVLVLVAAPSVSSVDVNTSVALCPSRESRMHGPLMTCNPGLS